MYPPVPNTQSPPLSTLRAMCVTVLGGWHISQSSQVSEAGEDKKTLDIWRGKKQCLGCTGLLQTINPRNSTLHIVSKWGQRIGKCMRVCKWGGYHLPSQECKD
ncbi:unnamed protein product [Rangifer tarandus platyrhynchus]|uniref:Uncharacterized protein n=1 Tax=Rangifer tarandus platyrhynchus TaxID=3082113 RepID=A0ABN8Y148_RANTA|nr:unnamed protein product [Rangifer tarandus platyrhynchus]